MAFDTNKNDNLINFTNSTRTPAMTISATTEQTIPLESRLPIMATFITLYALIFFFGITGNALVICKDYFFFLNTKKKIICFSF